MNDLCNIEQGNISELDLFPCRIGGCNFFYATGVNKMGRKGGKYLVSLFSPPSVLPAA